MRIVTLLENNVSPRVAVTTDANAADAVSASGADTGALENAHGLSLYLETADHCILFDMGPGDEFAHNARALGIDLSAVDLAAISHGHFDHGKGLATFLALNNQAPVFTTARAFENHYSEAGWIGLDPDLEQHPQHRIAREVEEIAPGITLFSNIEHHDLPSPANDCLRDDAGLDHFAHEQSLLIEEEDKLVLIGGCAHRGIVNILETAKEIAGRYPDVVISGFHLAIGGQGACAVDNAYLDEFAARLLASGAAFYTGHCTGSEAYKRLAARMGDVLHPCNTGDEVIV